MTGDMTDGDRAGTAGEIAERIGGTALAQGLSVAVAESLTSGAIASQLGAAADSSVWFAGGVVAYAAETKFRVLNVDPGPVVNARCAGCHALKSPTSVPPKNWRGEVREMREKRAVVLGEPESEAIVRYLEAVSARNAR